MMTSNFSIVGTDKATGALVIRDNDDGGKSVTNDAERVVESLLKSGELKENQRLFYWDSDNNPGEIKFEATKALGQTICMLRGFAYTKIEVG